MRAKKRAMLKANEQASKTGHVLGTWTHDGTVARNQCKNCAMRVEVVPKAEKKEHEATLALREARDPEGQLRAARKVRGSQLEGNRYRHADH